MELNTMVGVITAESAGYKEKFSKELNEVHDYYEAKYGNNIKLTDMDIYAIGKYTETVQKYAPFMEANDNSGLGNLGDAVRGNMGLVSTQYATSIVPLLASVQPKIQWAA